MSSVLLAGGGTAGHIEPALAVADALVAIDPTIRITALGTERGLETTLVPARGYDLQLIPAVPLPRKPSTDLLTLPGRMRGAIKATRAIMAEREVDVVVGFGGYVALPAYLAARGRVPIVIHEANATAGLANKIGARFAVSVAAAVDGSGLKGAKVVGNPVRRSLSELDRAGLRAQAREFFGLDPDAPTLLVFGGSQGAQRINAARRRPQRPTSPRPVSGCCTPTAGRTSSSSRHRCRPARPTSPCRTWTGWTWPTRRPTWCWPGRGR